MLFLHQGTIWYKRSFDCVLPSTHGLFLSFGGDALQGYHGTSDARWTEEYQTTLYKSQLPMLNSISFLRGMSPWILTDFGSPRRPLPGIQEIWNRKGLVSNHGDRKDAFYVLQSFYNIRDSKGQEQWSLGTNRHEHAGCRVAKRSRFCYIDSS